MTDSKDSFKQKLVSIRRKSAERLKQKINGLSRAWHSMLEADSDSVYLREMHAISHTVAGSGATLGFPLLSRLAAMLETLLTCVIDHDRRVSDEEYEQLGSFVLALQQSAELIDLQNLSSGAEAINDAVRQNLSAREKMVYWVGPLEQDMELLNQLSEQDYVVRHFPGWQELGRAVSESPPEVVITSGVTGSEAGSAAPGLVRENRMLPQLIPVLSITEADSFEDRLRLVRQGINDVLVRPVSVEKLQAWLDRNRISTVRDPFRVLIVDDDVPLANYYAFLLREAGMVVDVVNQPEKTMAALWRFQPELVLLDVYMPNWNGVEVATVIRQYDEFMGLPIVFLSRESDMQVRLSALERGGDNFLTKPVSPGHLVSVITGRVARYRQLKKKTGDMIERLNLPLLEEDMAATVVADSVIRLQDGIGKMMGYLQQYRERNQEQTGNELDSLFENANSIGLMMQEELSNLMFLQELKGGRELLELENFDIGELLEECCRAIRPAAETRSVHIAIGENACIHQCYVKADYGKVTEVILTLLTDSLRNTRDKGTVEVNCESLGDTVRISVSSRNVSPDTRGLQDQASSSSGARLAILQSLLRMMGGEFGLQTSLEQGELLWVDLPCAYCIPNDPGSK